MSVISAPLAEGQAFATGSEAVYAVQDYALSTHKAVRVERASGADRKLVCASEQHCAFFVQIYRQRLANKTGGKWYIASMQLTHSDTCDSKCRLSMRQIAELPAFKEAVRENPRISVETLVALVLESHGVSLDKKIRLVYRARELVRSGKAVNRCNMLPSPDAPLPVRDFVQRLSKENKLSPEPKKPKPMNRMAWTDAMIESLLIQRILKHGEEFVKAGDQVQLRKLWAVIRQEFSELHSVMLTISQLRAKFRYLQDQYVRVRADEEAAGKDPDKLVVYPRCWDMLTEYFGEAHNDTSLDGNHDEMIVLVKASTNGERELDVESGVTTESPDIQAEAEQSVLDLVGQTQFQETPSPERSDLKRQRVNPPEDSVAQQESLQLEGFNPVMVSASPVNNEFEDKLAVIQNTQNEMARSLDGMKEVVKQSSEAIRGLQQALSQSNQVNAALLEFLSRQPGT